MPAPRLPTPPIPGLRVRAFDPTADFGPLAALLCEINAVDDADWRPSEAVLRAEWADGERFHPATDAVVAEVDGRPIAIGETSWRVRAGEVHHDVRATVHPDFRRRGLGRALVRWAEGRARDLATAGVGGAGPDPDGRLLVAFAEDHVAGAAPFLASLGFRPHTFGFLMRRPLDLPIEAVPMPAGLKVRPVRPDDHRAIWDADTEAFLDHPESALRDEDDFAHWFAQPGIDTSMWRVAWAGRQVAGSVMTFVWAEENSRLGIRRGWLEHVSVRRPWRGRGLARALISESLRMLADAGYDEAMLGVHGDNPTGAVALYERCGFEVHRRWTVWRKPLAEAGARG